MDKFVIKFDKPMVFEETEYTEVDFSAIQDFSTKELAEAQKALAKLGVVTNLPETDLTYNILLASKATGLPMEFFEQMPGKYGTSLKAKIGSYFLED